MFSNTEQLFCDWNCGVNLGNVTILLRWWVIFEASHHYLLSMNLAMEILRLDRRRSGFSPAEIADKFSGFYIERNVWTFWSSDLFI